MISAVDAHGVLGANKSSQVFLEILQLAPVDKIAFRQATDVPNNVRLAVRRFESVYTRGLRQREDRIIDQLIALEALAGSGTELRFRLAFRISALLASDDDERLALFEAMKRYYDVRSKIVHGGDLRAAELSLVQDDGELRTVARRLVRAVIFATVHSDLRLTGKYIDGQLDRALLDTHMRQKLQAALGIEMKEP